MTDLGIWGDEPVLPTPELVEVISVARADELIGAARADLNELGRTLAVAVQDADRVERHAHELGADVGLLGRTAEQVQRFCDERRATTDNEIRDLLAEASARARARVDEARAEAERVLAAGRRALAAPAFGTAPPASAPARLPAPDPLSAPWPSPAWPPSASADRPGVSGPAAQAFGPTPAPSTQTLATIAAPPAVAVPTPPAFGPPPAPEVAAGPSAGSARRARAAGLGEAGRPQFEFRRAAGSAAAPPKPVAPAVAPTFGPAPAPAFTPPAAVPATDPTLGSRSVPAVDPPAALDSAGPSPRRAWSGRLGSVPVVALAQVVGLLVVLVVLLTVIR